MKRIAFVVLIALMLLIVAGGCVPGGPITIGTVGQQPTINSFNADPLSISAGESSTLTWNVSGAATVSIDQGIGNVALSGRRVVMPDATTVYTMTAMGTSGASVSATAQVVVSGAPAPIPTPSPTPTPSSLPVINYFMANPPTIPAGWSTTLSWDVLNATSVNISPDVGAVGTSGSTDVSPATSTNYTLTASNAAGWRSITIVVLLTGVPGVGEPDLVVESITRSGDKISYKIKNIGSATAGPSTSTLLIDDVVVANDSVGSLAPGESKTETFTGYEYACTLPGDTAEVRVDTGGAVAESSEANNSYSTSWSCLMVVIPGTLVVKTPDLVIEDIWLVHEITGDKIYYRIKNNGSLAAGASTSGLYIYPCIAPCAPVATDYVASLDAGESRVEKFASYNYTGIGVNVGVKADINSAVTESDEDNNSRTEPASSL